MKLHERERLELQVVVWPSSTVAVTTNISAPGTGVHVTLLLSQAVVASVILGAQSPVGSGRKKGFDVLTPVLSLHLEYLVSTLSAPALKV